MDRRHKSRQIVADVAGSLLHNTDTDYRVAVKCDNCGRAILFGDQVVMYHVKQHMSPKSRRWMGVMVFCTECDVTELNDVRENRRTEQEEALLLGTFSPSRKEGWITFAPIGVLDLAFEQ